MASVSTSKKSGLRRVQFFAPDGKRKTLHLGKVSLSQARDVSRHIESLMKARRLGNDFNEQTTLWLRDLDDDMRARLAELELIEPVSHVLLGPFVAEYIAKRDGVLKPSTLHSDRQTEGSLLGHFGANKRLRDITIGDAKDFRSFLLKRGGQSKPNESSGELEPTQLSEATVRKRCSVAGTILQDAVERGLIVKNPFKTKAVPRSHVETKRTHEITEADALKVLAELPGTQWPLLFALSRWGGLRVGSEVRRLTWADILWDQNAINVTSPKTERYEGHATRMLPMFPELTPLLLNRSEDAIEGDILVLPMLSGRTDASLRKPLLAAIKRAGLKAWPRLWHNMRATRQTELSARFPLADVCAWLGNSLAVAAKHYVRPTDGTFALATQKETQTETDRRGQKLSKSDANSKIAPEIIVSSVLNSVQVLPHGIEP